MDLVTLALAKKYTDDTVSGFGSLQGKDGKSAYQIALDNGFIGTETDWLESLKGEIGASGEDGYSPSITESNENTENSYKLNIINKDNTFTTPNLKGETGSSGVYIGEEEPSDINIKVWIKPDGNANVIDGSVVGL